MDDQTTQAYEGIFKLVPETCKIAKVRLVRQTKNESGEKVFEFEAVVEAPTSFPDCDFVPLKMIEGPSDDEIGGPDIHESIRWKEKNKKRKFIFSAHLIPQNILGFSVQKGLYRIGVVCFGTFYV